MIKETIKVNNITCSNCAKTIETHFNNDLEGISAKVMVTSSKVRFEYDETLYSQAEIISELSKIGYYASLNEGDQKKQKRIDLIDLVIATIFSIPLLWTMFAHLGMTFIPVPAILMNGYFQWVLTTPVMFIAGRRFFIAAYRSVLNKNLGMDSLVVIGTSAAYFYSIYETIINRGNTHHLFFETAAVIIWMVLIGNYFENRIKEKTNETLNNLLMLGSKEAVVIKDGVEVITPIDNVSIGDIVLVKSYEKFPIDGKIIKGKTYVDESMLSGEAMPVLKEVDDLVIGSSINMLETVQIEVTKIGSETVLAKIIQTVEETTLIKPKAQRIADKVSSIFVPLVLVISIIVFISNNLYFQSTNVEHLTIALSRAIAVLVVSCPCALGLATPTSISVSSGIAFKEGILYKGGEFFELANKITAIAFDKTGTLTYGKPSLTDYLEVNENSNSIKYTASLEKHSTHPIAEAITNYYKDNLLEVTNFETLIGYGIKGTINKKEVLVVSISYINEHNIKNPFNNYELYQEQGKTVFFTIINNEVHNMIAVSDELKETSYNLINDLKSRGITPYMITGDQPKTANYIASKIGIDKVYAGVLPHEKANIIKEIQQTESVVAFVGDGINDAPALTMANVGFAIGSGSDIAIDTADVTLMNHDLGSVLVAIDLSKATLINIYLNFFWAFIYNIIMIPLAAFGIFSPTIAGIGMAFSSLMVVLNALSLKLYKYKKERVVNEDTSK